MEKTKDVMEGILKPIAITVVFIEYKTFFGKAMGKRWKAMANNLVEKGNVLSKERHNMRGNERRIKQKAETRESLQLYNCMGKLALDSTSSTDIATALTGLTSFLTLN